jgi:Ca2+-dependent lipid-binding protein
MRADTAIGVLQVTVYAARGLKATKIGYVPVLRVQASKLIGDSGGTPDPYVSFSISQRAELARSKVKQSSANPHWNDTKYLLVNSLNDVLCLSIMDWNEHRKDSELGLVNFNLKQLEQDPEQERIVSPIMAQGKEKGNLQFSVNFYPVIAPNKAKTETGSEEAIPESRGCFVPKSAR